MSCPHGANSNPSTCSQCIEAAGKLRVRIRRMTRDEATGGLLEDGQPVVSRPYMLPATGHAPLKTRKGGRPPKKKLDVVEGDDESN